MAKSDHKADPKSWKDFNRKRRDTDHIDNCTTGYRKKKKSQIHHILSISSLADSNLPKAKRSFIRACMKVSKWDINKAENNIGLPLKTAYLAYERASSKQKADKSWGDLPCHQYDHNPYYVDDVIDYLTKHIWDKLKAQKKKKKCEKVKGKAIQSDLDTASTHFRDFLNNRGSGADGKGSGKSALYCWDNRDTMKSTWYVPFSMTKVPTPRSAPASLPSNKKKALGLIFQKL